jgi:hypothetical protein
MNVPAIVVWEQGADPRSIQATPLNAICSTAST